MLVWNDNEANATEYHVLAKVTEYDSNYPFKVIFNENTIRSGIVDGFKNAKPLSETVELTVAEVSKLLDKTVKIIK